MMTAVTTQIMIAALENICISSVSLHQGMITYDDTSTKQNVHCSLKEWLH